MLAMRANAAGRPAAAAYYSAPHVHRDPPRGAAGPAAGPPARAAARPQARDLLGADGPLARRRAGARGGGVELLRHYGRVLGVHPGVPGAEPAAGAGGRRRAV